MKFLSQKVNRKERKNNIVIIKIFETKPRTSPHIFIEHFRLIRLLERKI